MPFMCKTEVSGYGTLLNCLIVKLLKSPMVNCNGKCPKPYVLSVLRLISYVLVLGSWFLTICQSISFITQNNWNSAFRITHNDHFTISGQSQFLIRFDHFILQLICIQRLTYDSLIV